MKKQTAFMALVVVSAQLALAQVPGREVQVRDAKKSSAAAAGASTAAVAALTGQSKAALIADIASVLKVSNSTLPEMFGKRPILAELASDAVVLAKKGKAMTEAEAQYVEGTKAILSVLGKNRQVTKLTEKEQFDITLALKMLDVAAQGNEYAEGGAIPAKIVNIVSLMGKHTTAGALLPEATRLALIETYGLKKDGKVDEVALQKLSEEFVACKL